MVVGDGEYLAHIKQRVRHMGLQNVHFTGAIPHEQMPSYYAMADAGILPLRNNRYDESKGPIKLYEYMAMELPVIATPIGEPKLMIEAAQCGILIPFNNAARAAAIIQGFCDSEDAMHRMGKNGRVYLEKHQTLTKQAAMLERSLSSVA